MSRRAGRSALVAVAVVVLAGCGLPVPGGVQRPGPAAERAQQPDRVNVLPPGPRPDADAAAVVEGFLGAQSSPRGDHAVARQFLAEGVRWSDDEAAVFSARSAAAEVSPGAVQVRYELLGTVREDGTWLTRPRTEVVTYRLQRAGASWRLTSVPQGLHLSVRDRDDSFDRRSVHYLSATSPAGALVAEPVFQPVGAPAAQALVERLLAGPSADLAPAVRSALPTGTRLTGPVQEDGGVVTVELDEGVQELAPGTRRAAAAQLVWTLSTGLPAFQALRLRAGGRPLLVDGEEERRVRDVDEQAPTGLPANAPALFVRARALRTLSGSEQAAVEGDQRPVDVVAASPTEDLLLVLTRTPGRTTLSTGPLGGPLTPRAFRGVVTSPSFGSGAAGAWFLEGGAVHRLTRAGAVVQVPVEGSGEVTSLAVSRDGARVALVRGGRLLVGRVEPGAAGQPRVAGLRSVAPSVQAVRDVVWSGATELVVLGSTDVQDAIPVRVTVDGARVVPVTRTGVDGAPLAVAAAAEELLVAAGGRIYRDTRQGFVVVVAGTAPAFPG